MLENQIKEIQISEIESQVVQIEDSPNSKYL